ncbi:hypothetical protein SteCoe_31491 [Stentor coeruleus]|uniref:Uncharacterized protein n=1 Tax=Stentor coeruleus TaxID=5963 RepID=A0A1R2B1A5_9CILI|nr:hypothetical protein SteCoe_31491 [Stentor coeruleus]
MRITMALSSVGRAFAYLLGVRPRVLIRKYRKVQPNTYLQAKLETFAMINKADHFPVRRAIRGLRLNTKFLLESAKDDLRSVFEPIQSGPMVKQYGNIKCRALHRVSVRTVLQAVSTTESVEIQEELDALNTTHSSIIESEEMALLK